MEATIVGLPYYGYQKLKNTLVAGKVVSLIHDEDNSHSKTAVVVHFNSAKIGYVTGRESTEVLKHIHLNSNRGVMTLASIVEVRESCLKVKLEDYGMNIHTGRKEPLATPQTDTLVTLPNLLLADTTTNWAKNPAGEVPLTAKYASVDSFQLNKPKEETMFDKIVNTNTAMARSAAFLEAGRIANNTAAKFVASKSPLMVKGYVDTAFGKLLIANAAAVAANKFRPTDAKLAKLAEAMITQAYQEVYQLVDIEKMLNEMLSSESVKAALSKLDNSDEYAE